MIPLTANTAKKRKTGKETEPPSTQTSVTDVTDAPTPVIPLVPSFDEAIQEQETLQDQVNTCQAPTVSHETDTESSDSSEDDDDPTTLQDVLRQHTSGIAGGNAPLTATPMSTPIEAQVKK